MASEGEGECDETRCEVLGTAWQEFDAQADHEKVEDEEQSAEIDDLRGKLRAMEEETKRRQEELPGLIERAVNEVLNARRQTAVAFGSGLGNPVSYSFGPTPRAE